MKTEPKSLVSRLDNWWTKNSVQITAPASARLLQAVIITLAASTGLVIAVFESATFAVMVGALVVVPFVVFGWTMFLRPAKAASALTLTMLIGYTLVVIGWVVVLILDLDVFS